MASFDETHMEDLYEEGKVLIDPIEWIQNRHTRARFSTEARVETVESNEILLVQGQRWGPAPAYSFSILYQNTAIRVWDCNYTHHDGIEGGHKHMYRESQYVDYEPYGVNDVSTSDPNQALNDFLAECNVEYNESDITPIPELPTNG